MPDMLANDQIAKEDEEAEHQATHTSNGRRPPKPRLRRVAE